MKVFCPYCNEDQEYYIQKKHIKTYKGIEVNVTGKVGICQKCNNELYIYNLENETSKKIYEKYRKIEKLIKPQEIIDFRERVGLSQRELTYILQLGKMTINSYERGALPTKAQSDYIKIMINYMEKFYNKTLEAKQLNLITQKTYEKVASIYLLNVRKEEDYCISELVEKPNIYNGFVTFDIEKTINLISYIASRVNNLYITSLNKYLCFIDMLAFKETTKSVTGLRYQKEQYGPVIYKMKYIEVADIKEKFVKEYFEKEDGSCNIKIKSLNNYDISLFNKKEIDVINKVIKTLKNKTVTNISNLSHNEISWKDVEMHKPISYEYAMKLKSIE